jgi:hypothetical protein
MTACEISNLMELNELTWRQLLARAYGGPNMYRDDGEMQDNSCHPHIDFLRDSALEIHEKIHRRADWQRRGNPLPMVIQAGCRQ